MTTYKRRKRLSKTWVHENSHLHQCGRCGQLSRWLNRTCSHGPVGLIYETPCSKGCEGVHPTD